MYLKFVVEIFQPSRDLHVGHEEVVASGDGLHDVSLDLFVLKDGNPVVDQDRRLRGLEVRPETWLPTL